VRKQRTKTIITNFRWGGFLVVLLFLGIQIIPHALGQRGQPVISKRISEAPSHMDGGTWTVTGSLNTGRFLHTATLLPNGMGWLQEDLMAVSMRRQALSRTTR